MDRKADYAYQIIRSKIITGEYPPMTDLSEEALQKELGFSRTPVREAILRLRDNGFIIVFPKKGTIVSPVSHDLIEEIYEVRLVNEPYICQRASKTMPRSILESIREKLLTKPEIHGEPGIRLYYISLDDQLHRKILQYCGNSFLVRTMSLVYAHNDRFRYFSSNPVNDNSIAEHTDLIDAMLSQDMDLIEEKARSHILASKQITLKTFSQSKIAGDFQTLNDFDSNELPLTQFKIV